MGRGVDSTLKGGHDGYRQPYIDKKAHPAKGLWNGSTRGQRGRLYLGGWAWWVWVCGQEETEVGGGPYENDGQREKLILLVTTH